MDLIEKRVSGIGDQPSFPAAQRSHNFDGLVASPPNLQLIPTIATGEEGVWLKLPLPVPLPNWASSCGAHFEAWYPFV